MYIVQRVLNYFSNINPSIKTYVLSLIISSGRKNCAAMADSINISPKRLYSFLDEAENNIKEIEKKLLLLADETKKENVPRVLVVDPTAIIKPYAKNIEKLSHDRSGCSGRVEKGLVPVYVIVTDKHVTIPLNSDFWVQEKIVGKKKYKSKATIAQELINYSINNKVRFDFIALDGAFAIPVMFDFFQNNKFLKFIMRIARNRKIKTKDGIAVQLKYHPALRLYRNEREKTVVAELYGNIYYFTAQKREKRGGGWEIVFLVSNMDLPAKEQVAAYNLRWPMEKKIRTTKQKFGAMQCQAIEASKQQAHIMAGFLAYATLNIIANDKQIKSVDVLVKILKDSHFDELAAVIRTPKQSRQMANVMPDEETVQSNIQNLVNYIVSVVALTM